jgi:outer membrane lipoprotein-sorting protein
MRETLMRTAIWMMALGLVLAASPAARAQTPTAEDLVARNLAARGGEDKLRGVSTMKMTGTVSAQGMQMPITVMTKRPNRMLQETIVQGTRMVQAFDGERAWAINPMLGSNQPTELNGTQAESLKDQSTFDGPLVGYKERGDTLELAGPADIAGGKAWKLRLTRKNGRSMFIYLDAQTYLEKEWSTTVDQNGMSMDFETVMSDYAPTPEGIMVARTLRTMVGGQQQGMLKVLTVEFNTPIDDTAFKKP